MSQNLWSASVVIGTLRVNLSASHILPVIIENNLLKSFYYTLISQLLEKKLLDRRQLDYTICIS